MNAELVAASAVPPATRAGIFTASYADYFTPVHVDQETLREGKPRVLKDDAPWQSARPRLEELEELEVDGGAILYRPGDRIAVVQLAARDDEAAAELLAAARARGSSLHYVNAPSGSPGSRALDALGASLDLRQLEMCLRRTTGPRG